MGNMFSFDMNTDNLELLSNCLGTMVYMTINFKNMGYKDDDICRLISKVLNVDVDPDIHHSTMIKPILETIDILNPNKGDADSFIEAYDKLMEYRASKN